MITACLGVDLELIADGGAVNIKNLRINAAIVNGVTLVLAIRLPSDHKTTIAEWIDGCTGLIVGHISIDPNIRTHLRSGGIKYLRINP